MKKEIPEIVWVTDLAITEGIFQAKTEATHCEARISKSPTGNDVWLWPNGHAWKSTREKAIKKAKTMRLQAVNKLKEQIEALEALNFEATAKSL